MSEKSTGIKVVGWEKITENDEPRELPQREILVQKDAKKCAAYAAFNAIVGWAKRNKEELIILPNPEGLFNMIASDPRYLDRLSGMTNNDGVSKIMIELNKRFNPSGIFINVESTGAGLLKALQSGDTVIFHNGVNHEIALLGCRDGMIEVADSLNRDGRSQWKKINSILVERGNVYNMCYVVTNKKKTSDVRIKSGDTITLGKGKIEFGEVVDLT